jgi:hypothetical protein
MKLTQKPYHLVLRRCIVFQVIDGLLPDIINAARTIHQTNDVVRCRRQAMVLTRGAILQDIPEIAAEVMPVNHRVISYRRPKFRHAIPGRTEHRRDHQLTPHTGDLLVLP